MPIRTIAIRFEEGSEADLAIKQCMSLLGEKAASKAFIKLALTYPHLITENITLKTKIASLRALLHNQAVAFQAAINDQSLDLITNND